MQSLQNVDREASVKKNPMNWKLRYNVPQNPNYENLYHYKQSKKIFNGPCYDLDLDKPPDSYKNDFFLVKTAFDETECRLKYVKDKAEKQKAHLRSQWKDLEEKENALKQTFITFSSFVIDNKQKQHRARTKYEDVKATKEQRIKAVESMRLKIDEAKKVFADMKKNIEAYSIYDNYLQKVVDDGPFNRIQEVISSYYLMSESRKKLAERWYENNKGFQIKWDRHLVDLENARVTYLGLCTKLSELTSKYDEAKRNTAYHQRTIAEICTRFANLAGELWWSKLALKHILEMTYYRSNESAEEKYDVDKMIRINNTLKALQAIEEKLQKLNEAKDEPTSLMVEQEEPIFEIQRAPKKRRPSVLKKMDYFLNIRPKKTRLEVLQSLTGAKDYVNFLDTPTGDRREEEEEEEAPFPIKLSPSKMKRSKIKDFEDRYRKALIAIRSENESCTKIQTVKSVEEPLVVPKWVQNLMAPKPSDTGRASPILSRTPSPTPHSGEYDAGYTIYEDDTGNPYRASSDTTVQTMKMKQTIERRFSAIRVYDSEQILPQISSKPLGQGLTKAGPSPIRRNTKLPTIDDKYKTQRK